MTMYRGLIPDSKMNFFKEIKAIAAKNPFGVSSSTRLIANIGDSTPDLHKYFLISATQSVLLYGVIIWAVLGKEVSTNMCFASGVSLPLSQRNRDRASDPRCLFY